MMRIAPAVAAAAVLFACAAACDPGQYYKGFVAGCTSCAAGQFSDGAPGNYPKSCNACAPGTHSSSGAASCTACGPGTHSSADHSSCLYCDAGTYSSGGAASCDVCPAGSSSASGSSTVTACHCNPGYHGTILTTSSTCTACERGRYKAGSTPGATCQDCELGRYQDQTGQPQCISCGGRDGCTCHGVRKDWPATVGGICRQGAACNEAQNQPLCAPTSPQEQGARCIPSGPGNTAHKCDCHDDDIFGLTCERTCAESESQAQGSDGWCANLGRCVYDPDAEQGYLCDCSPSGSPSGWSGAHCEIMDPCIVLNPCTNGATCNVTAVPGEHGYVCTCPTGFSGKNCEILTSEWGSSESDWSQLIIGGATVVCYFGIYWQLLVSSLTKGHHALLHKNARILVPAAVCAAVIALVFGISAVVHGFDDSLAPDRVQTVRDDLVMYGTAVGATILQVAIALCLHRWTCRWFPNFEQEGASRLRRGAGLPLLALFSATPSIVLGIWTNPDRLSPAQVDIVADVFVIDGWMPITFGVLFSSLSIAVVLARVYLKETQRDRGDCERFLLDCGVPHPRRFLFAEKSFAALSGLLFPFFWISYLVNEQQEFLSFAKVAEGFSTRTIMPELRYTRWNGHEHASVDGVRALSPVVCTLNFIAAGWAGYMICVFPAPLVWTPSMFFGMVWCAAVAIMLIWLSLVLIFSLSESKELADNRYLEIVCGYGQHGNIPDAVVTHGIYHYPSPTRCQKFKEYLCCIKNFCGSWTGQTLISGINHLAAIFLFVYGLHEFPEHITPALRKFLYSGIGLTVFGFVSSMASLFQRRWPRFKRTPTDDSFRLACVLKALLVMCKALIVYELSKINIDTGTRLDTWYTVVFYVCCASVFILAILTCAFDVLKVKRNPDLLEDAGVENGPRFIRMYGMSFFCCKLAIFFFVLLGHIPHWSGCNSDDQFFKLGTHAAHDIDASIQCTVCYAGNTGNNELCDARETHVYYACNTTCTKLFFSGAGKMPVSLDVFVLLPLMWLPFSVYANNEVARMIDGIWQKKKDQDNLREASPGTASRGSLHSAARVGLSSTGHGYSAIANLSHAVFLLCCATMVYFLAKAGGSYNVHAPPGLEGALQGPLGNAGLVVTGSVVVLNMLMMVRFLYEKCSCCGARPRRQLAGSE